MTTREGATESFGANAWLVDEMYERYVADPNSVAESWRDFFADYKPATLEGAAEVGSAGDGSAPAVAPSESGRGPSPSERSDQNAGEPSDRHGESAARPIRGAAARIVANMEASLQVPTATSFREVPARSARGQPHGRSTATWRARGAARSASPT